MRKNPKPKIIAVIGPTASGKSALAVGLARKFNGEIISADSRQVYKGLDIGSGKITKKEMRGITHHLLDVASPQRIFTVARYQRLGEKAIKKILSRNRVPIICGGTGLYVNSLIYQKDFPQIPPQPKLRKELEKLPTEKLFQKLSKLDLRRAGNIDRHNRRRLIRALEISIAGGKPVPATSINRSGGKKEFSILIIGIKKSKEELERLIKKRLEKRLKQGMIEEVKTLRESGLSWKRLDDLGLEYRYISRYLRGSITESEMKNLILKESLKYAKRQMTWFRKNKEIIWIETKTEAKRLQKDSPPRFLKKLFDLMS